MPAVEFLPTLLSASLVTIELMAYCGPLAILNAFVFGLLRLSSVPTLRILSRVATEFLRGVSALVLLFWLFFALPLVGISLEPMLCGVLALGFSAGAYGAEIVRGAILAVPRVQHEAALALNLSRRQRMMHVIVPQALPTMLPPFGNLMIELLKSTSLVSMVTIADLTFRAVQLNATYLRTVEIFALVLAIYFVLSLTISGCTRAIESRLGRSRWRAR